MTERNVIKNKYPTLVKVKIIIANPENIAGEKAYQINYFY
jgi:hypothetical protein